MGEVMIKSVETRISLSTFKVPPCCSAIISRVRDNPKPTAYAVGLLVKKIWQIFALISRETLMVLSPRSISTTFASVCVFSKFLRGNLIFIYRLLATHFSAFEIEHNKHEQ
ncbi:hypothetical protein [Microcoleus sp. D3_18a_C4]|uniref:hypothetical protein n=1 Tax=unclassified Microcoleus TaxID=2642155 RepID=UPI002FCEC3C6